MTETNYEHLVSACDCPQWLIRHDYAYGDAETCGEMDATIFVPCNGSKHTIVYEVATMRDVPLRWDELDGENVIDRDDPRVKELTLLVHAPDMLNAIRKAVMRLETLTGLHGDDEACHEAHKRFVDHATWQVLAEIECDLIRAYDAATDTESV